MEVSVAFLFTDFAHTALDTHHSLELYPVKLQRSKGVTRQLLTFAAVVIGVPNQSVVVIAFDEHHAGARAHIAADGGQGHGVGLRHLCLQGFMQPLLELPHRMVLCAFFQ